MSIFHYGLCEKAPPAPKLADRPHEPGHPGGTALIPDIPHTSQGPAAPGFGIPKGVIRYLLSVIGCRLSVIGCSLSASGGGEPLLFEPGDGCRKQ